MLAETTRNFSGGVATIVSALTPIIIAYIQNSKKQNEDSTESKQRSIVVTCIIIYAIGGLITSSLLVLAEYKIVSSYPWGGINLVWIATYLSIIWLAINRNNKK